MYICPISLHSRRFISPLCQRYFSSLNILEENDSYLIYIACHEKIVTQRLEEEPCYQILHSAIVVSLSFFRGESPRLPGYFHPETVQAVKFHPVFIIGGGVVITQLCVLYVFHIINNLIKDKKLSYIVYLL